MLVLLLMTLGAVNAKTCYKSTTTRTPYKYIAHATVETPAGCELLCDARSECVAFSFKEAGSSSSCVLLQMNLANEICVADSTIYLKQTVGCDGDKTTIEPATVAPTTTRARRMIGIVSVAEPAPLRLQVFSETLDVSNNAQWNTATKITVQVLASGCTITVTDSTKPLRFADSTPTTVYPVGIKQIDGVCS